MRKLLGVAVVLAVLAGSSLAEEKKEKTAPAVTLKSADGKTRWTEETVHEGRCWSG